jgi:nucleotide-binding universal stress UspA family protein
MPLFKKILSPIDFSDPSHQALDVAVEMASRLGAELLLVHVVPAIPDAPTVGDVLKEGDYEQKLQKDAATQLAEIAAQCAKKGVAAKSAVGEANDVAMELIRTAEQNAADLIVISTHGMTGWRSMVFGSVTEKVVRDAQCPVLILRTLKPAESN